MPFTTGFRFEQSPMVVQSPMFVASVTSSYLPCRSCNPRRRTQSFSVEAPHTEATADWPAAPAKENVLGELFQELDLASARSISVEEGPLDEDDECWAALESARVVPGTEPVIPSGAVTMVSNSEVAAASEFARIISGTKSWAVLEGVNVDQLPPASPVAPPQQPLRYSAATLTFVPTFVPSNYAAILRQAKVVVGMKPSHGNRYPYGRFHEPENAVRIDHDPLPLGATIDDEAATRERIQWELMFVPRRIPKGYASARKDLEMYLLKLVYPQSKRRLNGKNKGFLKGLKNDKQLAAEMNALVAANEWAVKPAFSGKNIMPTLNNHNWIVTSEHGREGIQVFPKPAAPAKKPASGLY